MISPQLPADIVRDAGFSQLKDFIIETTGLAYYTGREADLATRIGRRLAASGKRSCGAYLDLLLDPATAESELDLLITELTIGETYFFRHHEQFDALRRIVLPAVIDANQPTRRLRIWSAGCATGPEPYTVAIILRREFWQRLAGWDVTLVGTDMNREALAQARQAVYDPWALRSVPEEILGSCFSQQGKQWALRPEFRDIVNFQYHNLIKHPVPSLLNNLFSFDIILCRNVTIYFNADITRKVVHQFHEALADKGWLLVGHAEPNVEIFRSFEAVNAEGTTLYRKGPATPVPYLPPAPTRAKFEITLPFLPPPSPPPPVIASEAPKKHRPEASETTKAQPADTTDIDMVRTLADRGDWRRAAEACSALLKKDRLNAIAYYYQALIEEQAGSYEAAEQSLRRAIYVDRNFILAHYHLGLFLQRKNDIKGAERSFENARRLLAPMKSDAIFEHGDGITVSGLRELTDMHLGVLHNR